MTNEEWLNTLSTEEKAKFIARSCNLCSYDSDNGYCSDSFNVCKNGIKEWLKREHIEPMPEIKIGDVIYCNICKSRARFVVMSDIHASNLNGIFIRWREKNDIWKIERMNDETGFLEVIWRADDE